MKKKRSRTALTPTRREKKTQSNQTATQSVLKVYEYSTDQLKEYETKDVRGVALGLNSQSRYWFETTGIHDSEFIKSIGEAFQLHSLLLEDVVDIEHQTKIESYDNCVLLIVKIPSKELGEVSIRASHLALVLKDNILISFREPSEATDAADTTILKIIRERILNSKSKIRKSGSDYLFYSILDMVMERYHDVLEYLERKIEEIEEKMSFKNESDSSEAINELHRELIYLKKSVRPLKDPIRSILRNELDHFDEKNMAYFRDLSDQLSHVLEDIESYNEHLFVLYNRYTAFMSSRINEVMKTLTIFASIFIPLTFLTGVYGMNFDFMPELRWKYGYAMFWTIALALASVMLFQFKKRGWW